MNDVLRLIEKMYFGKMIKILKFFFRKMADEKNGEDDNETNIGGLDVIQSMIDISAGRLEGLRTQCVTSAELTQKEIRSLETKLVKMFSELLITKAKLPERLPKGLPVTGAELKQWLRVVGKLIFLCKYLFKNFYNLKVNITNQYNFI